MFYETKLELMLRLASTFKVSTVEDALLDFTEDWTEHFESQAIMEAFKETVNVELLSKDINDVHEAIRYVRESL